MRRTAEAGRPTMGPIRAGPCAAGTPALSAAGGVRWGVRRGRLDRSARPASPWAANRRPMCGRPFGTHPLQRPHERPDDPKQPVRPATACRTRPTWHCGGTRRPPRGEDSTPPPRRRSSLLDVAVLRAAGGVRTYHTRSTGSGRAWYVYPLDAMPAIDAGLLDRRLCDVAEQPPRVRRLGGRGRSGGRCPGLAPCPRHGPGRRTARCSRTSRRSGWTASARPVSTSACPRWAPRPPGRPVTTGGRHDRRADTGIDATHPDLAGSKMIAEADFSDAPDTTDRSGHGTHVASIAAGRTRPPGVLTPASPPARSGSAARCSTTTAPATAPGSSRVWSGPPSRAPTSST